MASPFCPLVVLVELHQLEGSLRTGTFSALCMWLWIFPHLVSKLQCFSSPFYCHNVFEGDL